MLERLEIKNYEKHRNKVLEFGPITTLVGRSDAGKSACLRALGWVLLNSPSGRDFIRSGAKTAAVRLSVDGEEVLRETGKSNRYQLGEEEFKSFGRDVPDPIRDLVNVDSEINVQSQFDSFFWLALSPGEVARRLNQVVDLQIVDRCTAAVNKEIRDLESEIRIRGEDLETCLAKMADLDWVPECEQSWGESVVAPSQKAAKLRADVAVLGRMVSGAKESRESISRGRALYQSTVEVGKLCRDAKDRREEASRLSAAITTLREKQRNIKKLPERLDLDDLLQRRLSITGECRSLKSLVRRIRDQIDLVAVSKQRAVKSQRELSKVEVCPMCGGAL